VRFPVDWTKRRCGFGRGLKHAPWGMGVSVRSRTTIYAGLRELEAPATRAELRAGGRGPIRAKGGGRKKLTVKDPTLLSDVTGIDLIGRLGGKIPLQAVGKHPLAVIAVGTQTPASRMRLRAW
jgi:hypothetical protein